MPCDGCKKLFAIAQDSPQQFEPYVKALGGDTKPIHKNASASSKSRSNQLTKDLIPIWEDIGKTQDLSSWWRVRLSHAEMVDVCSQPSIAHCPTCAIMTADMSTTLLQGLLRTRSQLSDGYLVYKLKFQDKLGDPIRRERQRLFGKLEGDSRQDDSFTLSISIQFDGRLMPMTTLSIDMKAQLTTLENHEDGTNEYTGSSTSLRTVQEWLNECDDHHRSCRATQSKASKMPDRFIDVGTGDESIVRLRLADEQTVSAPYLTLSHRWGSGKSWVLTTSNIETYTSCIPLPSLPESYMDAISIARFLGIRYLWIDSLCILQDSLSDWRHQSFLMADVYHNSYCTIAASWATSDNQGCFFNRPPLQTVINGGKADALHPVLKQRLLCNSIEDLDFDSSSSRRRTDLETYINMRELTRTKEIDIDNRLESTDNCYPNHNLPQHMTAKSAPASSKETVSVQVLLTVQKHEEWLWRDHVDGSPLNKRGWVLQERLLSRRTIHFCRNQIFFECCASKACESLPSLQNKNALQPIASGLRKGPVNLLSGSPLFGRNMDKPYKQWQTVVESYTEADLTRPSDKLVAISGLAREAHAGSGDTYHAGLWRVNLLRQLLWKSDQPQKIPVLTYRAPSWSWAAVDSPVSFFYSQVLMVVPEAKILSVRTRGIDGAANSFGELEYGHLSATGILLAVQRCFYRNNEWRLSVGENMDETDVIETDFFPDIVLLEPPGNLKCLPIASIRKYVYKGHCVCGLVLVPSGEFKGEWKRIGRFTLHDKYSEGDCFTHGRDTVDVSIV